MPFGIRPIPIATNQLTTATKATTRPKMYASRSAGTARRNRKPLTNRFCGAGPFHLEIDWIAARHTEEAGERIGDQVEIRAQVDA